MIDIKLFDISVFFMRAYRNRTKSSTIEPHDERKTAEQNGAARGICEGFWVETRRVPAGILGGFQGDGTQYQPERAAKPRRRDILFCATKRWLNAVPAQKIRKVPQMEYNFLPQNKKASIQSKTAHRPLKNTVYPLPRQLAQEQ